jgi:hypothetical protein
MTQLRYREEEEEETPLVRVQTVQEEEAPLLATEEKRERVRVEVKRGLPLGIAQGALAAWVMTELARVGNPTLAIDGKSGWLLYAVLGATSGLAAATGRRNTAWSAAGMAAGALVSPPLLEWLCRVTMRPLPLDAAQTSLVLVAALLLGAFVWLKRWSVWRAAVLGAVGYWVLDYIFNTVRMPGGNARELLDAAWVSAEHGFLVGGLLALLRSGSQTLLDWRTRWVDRATDWTLERLRPSSKDA